MQVKNKKILIQIGVYIVTAIAGVLIETTAFGGICRSSFCSDFLSENVGQMLQLFSVFLILLSLILLFLRLEIYTSWWKFARIYLPIALLLILVAGLSSSGGSWGVSADFDAEITIWLTAGLFLIISLILIAVKSWRLRKGSL